MKPIVAIDMDGILTQCNEEIADCLGFNREDTYKHFGDFKILNPVITREEVDAALSDSDFFYVLEPILDAIECVNKLRNDFDVYILTRPYHGNYKDSIDGKLHWLKKYLPWVYDEDRWIMTKHKHLIYADLFIDDSVHHLLPQKEEWPTTITATLRYPWITDKDADLVGNNWVDLYNKIKEIEW